MLTLCCLSPACCWEGGRSGGSRRHVTGVPATEPSRDLARGLACRLLLFRSGLAEGETEVRVTSVNAGVTGNVRGGVIAARHSPVSPTARDPVPGTRPCPGLGRGLEPPPLPWAPTAPCLPPAQKSAFFIIFFFAVVVGSPLGRSTRLPPGGRPAALFSGSWIPHPASCSLCKPSPTRGARNLSQGAPHRGSRPALPDALPGTPKDPRCPIPVPTPGSGAGCLGHSAPRPLCGWLLGLGFGGAGKALVRLPPAARPGASARPL